MKEAHKPSKRVESMRRKVRLHWNRWSRGLLIAIICFVLLSAACDRPETSSQTASISPDTDAGGSQLAHGNGYPSLASNQIGAVQITRLRQDLENLQGERYTARKRAQVRDYLTRSLQSEGWTVEVQTFETGVNLIATWPTTQNSEQHSPIQRSKWLIGAHYDTVADSPGADDNGTGVAALLELGRIYAEHPKSAAHLMLVFFDREEQGLAGSLAFATPEQVAELKGAIILEMLGYACHEVHCQTYPEFLQQRPQTSKGDFITVVGDQEHPDLLKAFEISPEDVEAAELAPVFSLSVPFRGVLMPDLLRSDHAPFWLRGLGAVMVTDTANFRNPHYHQASDRLETLDLNFLENVTRRVVSAIELLLHQS